MSDKDLRVLQQSIDKMYLGILKRLETSENIMSTLVEDLKLAVAQNREVTASAVILMRTLMEKIQTQVDNRDLEGVQNVINEVRADSKTLGDAVAVNTPAAGEIKVDPLPTDTPPVSSPTEQLGDAPNTTPATQAELDAASLPHTSAEPVTTPSFEPPDTSGREPDLG